MKYIDEYRDPELARKLVGQIARAAADISRDITLMEVCGSHTYAIGRYGIRRLLPGNLRLVSGPGCPVCVTSQADVDRALYIAGLEKTVFLTFGDMMRVPGSGGQSLQKLRAAGADIRVISSAAQALGTAQAEVGKNVVLMGIGFETTAPTVAASIMACRRKEVKNISVFSVHKLVPPALKALTTDPHLGIDAFICPGHVSTITGTAAYNTIVEAGRPAVITGFEPIDILEGIMRALVQIVSGKPRIEIQYSRGVNPQGNARAREAMENVFQAADSEWRGLGKIADSGLALRIEYREYDALERLEVPYIESKDPQGCSCGEILRGLKVPGECPLFKKICSPSNPVGPCMVSSEGTCAAHFKYGN